ncbi:MAG: GDP-mannose 4,6-dehydratase, partial [Thermosphaera sp.]|nr:GDP-mannose 4,6-dehydratase [Thermosphaera sp.]
GGTAVVAKTCLELSKPLIYISSAAVYGDPVELPIREEHPQNPLSPYGLSKLMGERVVEFYGRIGLKHVVIRPFNVYGPGQSSAYAGVITKFITMACRGEPLLIHGDGLQTRDFIHVEDFSRLVELVIEEKPYGQVFNAGSGVATRILDLAKLIIKLTNGNVDVKHTNPRPGDIRSSWADITKAWVILGYKPMVTLEDGIKSIIPDLCRGVGQSVGL